MSSDDILSLLGLAEQPQPAPDPLAGLQSTSPEAVPAGTPPSPTALQLDPWTIRRGRELRGENPRLEAAQTGSTVDQMDLAIADFYGAAFDLDPLLQGACQDPQRLEFLKQLMETQEFRELRVNTMLDEVCSELAACAFAEQFAGVRQVEEESPTKGRSGEDMGLLKAAAKALTTARQDVQDCRDAQNALGLGPGSPGSSDPRAIAEMFRRVRNSESLKKILDMAGRYRRVAQSRQRQKASHGQDDMVGVVLDGEVSRLLPSELVQMADPDLELDALRRLVERQSMSRLWRSQEPVARGPIIVSVDESGSMNGLKGQQAKAIALALAWVARHQRRWIALVAYSGSTGERVLALPPGRWNELALMEWLEAWIGGGSDLDVPLREVPRYWSEELHAPKGKTDLILITDALVHVPDDLRYDFLAWKRQAKAKLITLVVGHHTGAALDGVSDETHLLPNLDADQAGVEKALSI